METYRFDEYGKVYALSNDIYIYIGKLNGKSVSKFIEEYEENLDYPDNY